MNHEKIKKLIAGREVVVAREEDGKKYFFNNILYYLFSDIFPYVYKGKKGLGAVLLSTDDRFNNKDQC